jgi:hypothetical protein
MPVALSCHLFGISQTLKIQRSSDVAPRLRSDHMDELLEKSKPENQKEEALKWQP